MNFFEAIKTCFSKYAVFSGRASRSEYWYFTLFNCLIYLFFLIGIDFLNIYWLFIFQIFISIFLFLPGVSVVARRLHDVNKSGWWQLILLTVIGFIPMIYWLTKESDSGKNTYGDNSQSSSSSLNKINIKTPNTLYKSPSETSITTNIKTPKKVLSNDKKEDLLKTDFIPTIVDNSDNEENYELTENEKQNLISKVKISSEEEEQIYSDISKESEPNNRKQGIWTKILIENDGDEKKTKISYMKFRVENIIQELKNSKYQDLYNQFQKEKLNLNKQKMSMDNFEILMKHREEFENLSVNKNVKVFSRIDIHNFGSKNKKYSIKIFKDYSKNFHQFFWKKPKKNFLEFTDSYNVNEEGVKKEIKDYFKYSLEIIESN